MVQSRKRDADTEGVADVLERFRAGARQRQAELACLDEELGRLPETLAAVRRQMDLEEPSVHREGGSAPIHFIQKVVYHLFSRRHHLSILRQQSRFNRSVALALEDIYSRQRRLSEALAAPSKPQSADSEADEGGG